MTPPTRTKSPFGDAMVSYVRQMAELEGLTLTDAEVYDAATMLSEGLEEDTAERWEHYRRVGHKLSRTYHDERVRNIVRELRSHR